jgi:hypothetical protein
MLQHGGGAYVKQEVKIHILSCPNTTTCLTRTLEPQMCTAVHTPLCREDEAQALHMATQSNCDRTHTLRWQHCPVLVPYLDKKELITTQKTKDVAPWCTTDGGSTNRLEQAACRLKIENAVL